MLRSPAFLMTSVKNNAIKIVYRVFRKKLLRVNNCQLDVRFRESSGRVLDSRTRGRGFQPHWRHCVVSLLEQDTLILI